MDDGRRIRGLGSARAARERAGNRHHRSVEIIKDGKFIYQTQPNASAVEFDYGDAASAAGESWYYVRVIQADRHMAWSSPIWVRYRGK